MQRQLTVFRTLVILGSLALSGHSPPVFAASAAGDTRTVTVDDPAVQMHAFTLTVPRDWKVTGMIARPGGCHGPSVAADGLTYTELAPDGITATEKLPGVTW